MMQKEQENAYLVRALLLKNRCLTDNSIFSMKKEIIIALVNCAIAILTALANNDSK